MGLYFLVALLLAVLVMNWRFLGLDRLFSAGDPETRDCRWWRDERKLDRSNQRWVCARCGRDGYSSDGRPPRECGMNRL